MTRRHAITLAREFRNLRGPHRDGAFMYRAECACGVDSSWVESEVLAAGHGSRHVYAMAVGV